METSQELTCELGSFINLLKLSVRQPWGEGSAAQPSLSWWFSMLESWISPQRSVRDWTFVSCYKIVNFLMLYYLSELSKLLGIKIVGIYWCSFFKMVAPLRWPSS